MDCIVSPFYVFVASDKQKSKHPQPKFNIFIHNISTIHVIARSLPTRFSVGERRGNLSSLLTIS